MIETRISKRPWLILRIETKGRELHGKFLLALHAAERGWGVVIGGKTATRSSRELLPRGVFMEKSIPPNSVSMIRAEQTLGHRVCAWCEEGLLYFSPEDYRYRRIEPESFDAIDYFFAWGQKQADDIFSVLKRGKERIVVSGNPRFDLLRPEFRGIFASAVENIREKYGKIILINSTFVAANNGRPEASDFVGYLKSLGRIKDAAHEALWRRQVALVEKVFPYYLELPRILSERFPDHTIVVRPHPSENDKIWKNSAEGLSNVKVIYEGSANEWILASQVIIQNNCTTAVEAFLLGKPAVSYRPLKDEVVEFALPNAVSWQADSVESLLQHIRTFTRTSADVVHDPTHKARLEIAKRYIANIENAPACQTIMERLEQLEIQKEEFTFSFAPLSMFLEPLRRIKWWFFPPKDVNYYKKKFPGITLVEMNELLWEFQRLTGRFSDVRVRQLGKDGFCVYRN